MTLILIILASAYTSIHNASKWAFIVLYSFTFFFANFGPNATTFITPVEVRHALTLAMLQVPYAGIVQMSSAHMLHTIGCCAQQPCSLTSRLLHDKLRGLWRCFNAGRQFPDWCLCRCLTPSSARRCTVCPPPAERLAPLLAPSLLASCSWRPRWGPQPRCSCVVPR